ncbi:MAG: monovalent cation/H+ antiporter complex subunit F [Rhodospirillaceae bacterium]
MLTFETGSVIAWAANIAIVLIVIGGVCAFIRLVKGPSFPDRVVVLDLLSVLVVALAALFAITTGFSAYLDVSVAFALVSFLATVAFARFAERRHPGNAPDDALCQNSAVPPPAVASKEDDR